MIQYYYLSAMPGSVIEHEGRTYRPDAYERPLNLVEGKWHAQLKPDGGSVLKHLPLTTEQILITHVEVVAWLNPASADAEASAIVLHPDNSVREMPVSRLRWVKVAP